MDDAQQSTTSNSKSSRRQAILEALALELESNPGERVTTARLAKRLSVSEAALYRHFPSKATMFEGLITFAEQTIFSLINRILEQEASAAKRCEQIMSLVLQFSVKNPGISSVLVGTALTGETERLRIRVAQFFQRLETQLRQILREGDLKIGQAGGRPVNEIANLLLIIIEGQIQHFVRSGYRQSPLDLWEKQRQLLQPILREYL